MASRDRRMAAKHRKVKEAQKKAHPREACGKISYAGRKAAKEAARRIAGEPRPGDESRPHVDAYKCFLCHAWHVGHTKHQSRYTVATIRGIA